MLKMKNKRIKWAILAIFLFLIVSISGCINEKDSGITVVDEDFVDVKGVFVECSNKTTLMNDATVTVGIVCYNDSIDDAVLFNISILSMLSSSSNLSERVAINEYTVDGVKHITSYPDLIDYEIDIYADIYEGFDYCFTESLILNYTKLVFIDSYLIEDEVYNMKKWGWYVADCYYCGHQMDIPVCLNERIHQYLDLNRPYFWFDVLDYEEIW